MINGQLYDERGIAATVDAGTVEEWKRYSADELRQALEILNQR